MEKEVFSLANQLMLLITDYALDVIGALLLLVGGWIVACLLYTSDAADEGLGVDLGGRRII